MSAVIYLATNTVNQKKYVGWTIQKCLFGDTFMNGIPNTIQC